VTVEYIPTDTPEQAMEMVTNGQADIAIGVQPDWSWADRVDFTQPYLLHGYRLMVKQNSGIFGFAELRGGRTVATVSSQPDANGKAVEAAEKVNSLIKTAVTNEDGLSIFILEQDNAHVAFADSLILLPHLEAYPTDFQLTKDWYSERYMAMAVPRNDIDFRLLVDYTLQELARDGTLQRLWQPVLPAGETIEFDIWPGPREYLGFQLGRS
jgi:ABC-type amino acid transport substrate-binding protein